MKEISILVLLAAISGCGPLESSSSPSSFNPFGSFGPAASPEKGILRIGGDDKGYRQNNLVTFAPVIAGKSESKNLIFKASSNGKLKFEIAPGSTPTQSSNWGCSGSDTYFPDAKISFLLKNPNTGIFSIEAKIDSDSDKESNPTISLNAGDELEVHLVLLSKVKCDSATFGFGSDFQKL